MIALQAASSQPLALGANDDPSVNTALLATLVIPCLEIYLAAHNSVRFLLLEYTVDHLPTALALRSLIGDDLFKVSGILKGEDLEPSLPSRRDHAVRGKRRLLHKAAAKRSSSSSEENSMFSQIDFTVASTATDAEVATFVSTIWKVLISVSDFYAPEKPRKTQSRPTTQTPPPLEPAQSGPSSSRATRQSPNSTSGQASTHASLTQKPSLHRDLSTSDLGRNLPPSPFPTPAQSHPASPTPASQLSPHPSSREDDLRHRGDPRYPRDSRDPRAPQDPRDSRDFRDARDPRDFRDPRDPRDGRHQSDQRQYGIPLRVPTSASRSHGSRQYKQQQRQPERTLSPTNSFEDTVGPLHGAHNVRPRLQSLRPATAGRKGESSPFGREFELGYDDEEEEYDLDERRLVPKFLLPRVRKEGPRKALKFLGLA